MKLAFGSIVGSGGRGGYEGRPLGGRARPYLEESSRHECYQEEAFKEQVRSPSHQGGLGLIQRVDEECTGVQLWL